MKGLKIIQYALSLLHMLAQVFYFIGWANGIERMPLLAKHIDITMLSNANFQLSQYGFLYTMLSVFTLAFYMTVSNHISIWITEAKIDEAVGEKEEEQMIEEVNNLPAATQREILEREIDLLGD